MVVIEPVTGRDDVPAGLLGATVPVTGREVVPAGLRGAPVKGRGRGGGGGRWGGHMKLASSSPRQSGTPSHI